MSGIEPCFVGCMASKSVQNLTTGVSVIFLPPDAKQSILDAVHNYEKLLHQTPSKNFCRMWRKFSILPYGPASLQLGNQAYGTTNQSYSAIFRSKLRYVYETNLSAS